MATACPTRAIRTRPIRRVKCDNRTRMHARILEHDQLRKTTSLEEIRAALAAKLPIWVELDGPTADAERAARRASSIHPLTIEDIWGTRSAPKIEDYDNYLYVIIHGVRGAKRGKLDLIELDVVIGRLFVITHDPTERADHARSATELDRVAAPAREGPGVARARGARSRGRSLPAGGRPARRRPRGARERGARDARARRSGPQGAAPDPAVQAHAAQSCAG